MRVWRVAMLIKQSIIRAAKPRKQTIPRTAIQSKTIPRTANQSKTIPRMAIQSKTIPRMATPSKQNRLARESPNSCFSASSTSSASVGSPWPTTAATTFTSLIAGMCLPLSSRRHSPSFSRIGTTLRHRAFGTSSSSSSSTPG